MTLGFFLLPLRCLAGLMNWVSYPWESYVHFSPFNLFSKALSFTIKRDSAASDVA